MKTVFWWNKKHNFRLLQIFFELTQDEDHARLTPVLFILGIWDIVSCWIITRSYCDCTNEIQMFFPAHIIDDQWPSLQHCARMQRRVIRHRMKTHLDVNHHVTFHLHSVTATTGLPPPELGPLTVCKDHLLLWHKYVGWPLTGLLTLHCDQVLSNV